MDQCIYVEENNIILIHEIPTVGGVVSQNVYWEKKSKLCSKCCDKGNIHLYTNIDLKVSGWYTSLDE